MKEKKERKKERKQGTKEGTKTDRQKERKKERKKERELSEISRMKIILICHCSSTASRHCEHFEASGLSHFFVRCCS